jgi:ribosomal protein S18 acetylase RimI-like enzyme
MTAENTLLGRCTVAYSEAFEAEITSQAISPQSRRAGVAAVLEHLAAELLVMHQQDHRLSVHEMAQVLKNASGQGVQT